MSCLLRRVTGLIKPLIIAMDLEGQAGEKQEELMPWVFLASGSQLCVDNHEWELTVVMNYLLVLIYTQVMIISIRYGLLNGSIAEPLQFRF